MSKLACAYCGDTAGPFHKDHVVPRSRGGPDTPANLVNACVKCNTEKGDRLPSEWRQDLPEAVYEVERRVSSVVAVGIRARRGVRGDEKEEKPECRCERCGEELKALAKGQGHWGWVRWTVDVQGPSDGTGRAAAYRLQLVCARCHHNHDHPGLYDFPIEWAAGRRALGKCWQMMRDYRFNRSETERLADIMHALQYLPTWEGVVP